MKRALELKHAARYLLRYLAGANTDLVKPQSPPPPRADPMRLRLSFLCPHPSPLLVLHAACSMPHVHGTHWRMSTQATGVYVVPNLPTDEVYRCRGEVGDAVGRSSICCAVCSTMRYVCRGVDYWSRLGSLELGFVRLSWVTSDMTKPD